MGNKVYFHSLSTVFELSVGGATAWLCFTGSRLKKTIVEMSNPVRVLIMAGGMIILYLNVLLRSPLINFFLTAARILFFAFIIVDQCFNKSQFFKFSRSKWLSSLGKYTYGIYMLHPLVLLAINIVMVRIIHTHVDSKYSVAACFFAGLPLTIWLATLSYHYVEKRFLVLKEKFSFITMLPVKG